MVLFGPPSLLVPRRDERRHLALCIVLMGALAYLPVSTAIDSPFAGTPVDVAIDAAMMALWVGMTALVVRHYMHGNRLRRIKATIEYVTGLRRTLRNKTAVERLAILQEMRNCYAEADKYIAGVRDEEILEGIAGIRRNIESMYNEEAGEVRHTGSNAVEYARTMEKLGRDRDGGRTPPDP